MHGILKETAPYLYLWKLIGAVYENKWVWLFCEALRFLAFRSHLLLHYESQKHLLSNSNCQIIEDNDTNI